MILICLELRPYFLPALPSTQQLVTYSTPQCGTLTSHFALEAAPDNSGLIAAPPTAAAGHSDRTKPDQSARVQMLQVASVIPTAIGC